MLNHIRSNLHHATIYQEFKLLEEQSTSTIQQKRAKRTRTTSEASDTASSRSLLNMGVVAVQPKYREDGSVYQDRLRELTTMIIKCMLPISFVENEAFRSYIRFIDPSFTMPSVKTLRETGLNSLTQSVVEKIKKRLVSMESVSMTLDLWSDPVLRPFNGLICQGKKC